MILEGVGRTAPAPKTLVLNDGELRQLHGEAKRRAAHRDYKNSGTTWGQGLLGDIVIPNVGSLTKDERPIFAGLLGEYALATVINAKFPGAAVVDLSLRALGDFGVDLRPFGLTIDAKTRQREGDLHFVRRGTEKGRWLELTAKAFAFCEWAGFKSVKVCGWCWRAVIAGLLYHIPYEARSHLWGFEYREPLFGSGEIGFDILRRIHPSSRVWLNDLDPDLVCLWRSVHEGPAEFLSLVRAFKPTAEKFFEFKERDGQPEGTVADRGFRKLALHRMSVSGFGARSGGPIGGKSQANAKYTVECRWRPERIMAEANRLHHLMQGFERLRITCGDFEELLRGATEKTFVYLDPPYYAKGRQLYKHYFRHEDHERLAKSLRRSKCRWVLSYDDHPEIRRLYDWANFSDLFITYTNATVSGKRPKNREVAITP